jgi:hypothetical protein
MGWNDDYSAIFSDSIGTLPVYNAKVPVDYTVNDSNPKVLDADNTLKTVLLNFDTSSSIINLSCTGSGNVTLGNLNQVYAHYSDGVLVDYTNSSTYVMTDCSNHTFIPVTLNVTLDSNLDCSYNLNITANISYYKDGVLSDNTPAPGVWYCSVNGVDSNTITIPLPVVSTGHSSGGGGGGVILRTVNTTVVNTTINTTVINTTVINTTVQNVTMAVKTDVQYVGPNKTMSQITGAVTGTTNKINLWVIVPLAVLILVSMVIILKRRK